MGAPAKTRELQKSNKACQEKEKKRGYKTKRLCPPSPNCSSLPAIATMPEMHYTASAYRSIRYKTPIRRKRNHRGCHIACPPPVGRMGPTSYRRKSGARSTGHETKRRPVVNNHSTKKRRSSQENKPQRRNKKRNHHGPHRQPHPPPRPESTYIRRTIQKPSTTLARSSTPVCLLARVYFHRHHQFTGGHGLSNPKTALLGLWATGSCHTGARVLIHQATILVKPVGRR